MTEHDFSLDHISLPPRQATDGKAPAILLLHGFGANERDLLGLAPAFDPHFHVLSARAPHNIGPQMYAWYHLTMFADGSFDFDEEEARASLGQLHDFVDEAVEAYQLDPDQFYIVGFSQGAIQGSALLLTSPASLAGLVAMSGRWPTTIQNEIADGERLANKPVLAVHGLYDQVIPISYGRDLRDRWQQLPVDFTYQEFPMAHEVSMQSLDLVAAWLSGKLNEAAPNSAP